MDEQNPVHLSDSFFALSFMLTFKWMEQIGMHYTNMSHGDRSNRGRVRLRSVLGYSEKLTRVELLPHTNSYFNV